MRPTDKFGTLNHTSGAVELDADAGAEETWLAILVEDVREAVVDGMTVDDVCEEDSVEEGFAQCPCGTSERNPKQAMKARKIK